MTKPLVKEMSESILEKLIQGDGWVRYRDDEIREDRAAYSAMVRDEMRKMVYVS